MINVNLKLLKDLNLITARPQSIDRQSPPIEYCFHIFESHDKITLVNEKFVIWIVPDLIDSYPTTFTLVARNVEPYPTLELVFSSQGIYNTSRFVLQIVEAFLEEIKENECIIDDLDHK